MILFLLLKAFYINAAQLWEIMKEHFVLEARLWRVCGIRVAITALAKLPQYQVSVYMYMYM